MQVRKWFSLFILLLSAVMVVTDVLLSNTILPAIGRYFGASHAQMELVIASYLIGYAVFLIAGGRAGDRFGRKGMYIVGLLGFSLFSVLSAFSASITQLVFFRFLEGASAAVMSPQAIALIQITFRDPEERGRAFGFFGVALGVACVIGITGAGVLLPIKSFLPGWRLSFLITPFIGVLAVVLSFRFLEETTLEKRQSFDLAGLGILTIGLITLIYPIIEGRQAGWPLWAFFCLGGSVVILGGFLRNQSARRAGGKPVLIDPGLFRKGHYSKGLLAVLFAFAAHNAFLLVYLLFIRHYAGTGFLHSVFPLNFYGIGFMVSSLVSIRYVPRFGRAVPQTGIAIMILALLGQVGMVFADLNPWFFCGSLFVYGLGQAMVLPPLLNVTLTDLPKCFAGTAVGVYYTFQQFASTLGVAIIGGIFFSILEKGGNLPYRNAFTYGTVAIIVSLIVTGILLQRIPVPAGKQSGAGGPSDSPVPALNKRLRTLKVT